MFLFKSVAVVEDAVAPYECGKNEILVNVKAASVNVIDTKICRGYGRRWRWLLKGYNQVILYTQIVLVNICTELLTALFCVLCTQ